MPFRRTLKRRRSGGRPRTRWFAIVPGSRSVLGNNLYNFDRLQIQQGGAGGAVTVNFSDLVGGTIVRTILDIVCDPSILNIDGSATGWMYQHAGLFVSPEVSPNTAVWDPNVPSGDFMMRTFLAWYLRQLEHNPVAGELALSHVFAASVDGVAGHTIHMDTAIRRRIEENESPFLSWHTFCDTALVQGVSIGWTGRMLIRLP